MRELNYRFRRKDEATDVFSFPALRGVVTRFAGEVAISAEIASANAKSLGHSVADEVKILVFTGCCIWRVSITNATMGKWRGRSRICGERMKLPAGLTSVASAVKLAAELAKDNRVRG